MMSKEVGCVDQIFTLKQIGEKTWEKNVVFVGLRDEEEVYDRVNREASTEKV